PPDSERHISEFTALTHAALYLRRAVSRRQIRSLRMCLGGMSYTMVSCWLRGQNSSQNGQDVVKIFRLHEVYSTGERSVACLSLVSVSAQQEAGQDGIQPGHKGGVVMKHLVVGSMVLMLVTLGWGSRSLGQQRPAPRGELRVVDKHRENWAWITFNVF